MDDPFGLKRGMDDPFGLLQGLDITSCGAAPDGAPTEVPGCDCDDAQRRTLNGVSNYCMGCGLIADDAEPEPGDAPLPPGRFRIVGANAALHRKSLYQSAVTEVPSKKLILGDYLIYRQQHIENGGRAFPINACQIAADLYSEVQSACVKRSQNKKYIMAECLWRACIEIGYAPLKTEIASLMQLNTQGFARGKNFIMGLIGQNKMSTIEPNVDPCAAEIRTMFILLGYGGDEFAPLLEAVHAVVQTAIRNNIRNNSAQRSKVAGAAFEVLRRARLPGAPTLAKFCTKIGIRKNTVDGVLCDLGAFHEGFFREVYRGAGLVDDPPPV